MIRLLIQLFKRLLKTKRVQLSKVLLATISLIFFSTSGFLYFELASKPDLNWADSFWWAIVTMTTVGYGDFFPVTPGGRYLVAIPTMIFGISILGYSLSVIASYLIEARSKEKHGMAQITKRDHILIIHYPNLPKIINLVHEFRNDEKSKHAQIVLIDEDLKEIPPELIELDVKFVRGNATKENVLERANFREARWAVILAKDASDVTSDNHNLAVVLTIEKLRPEIITVVECLDPEHIDLMYKADCDSVISVEEISSELMVQEVLDPGVEGVIKQLITNQKGQQMYMVPVQEVASGQYGPLKEKLSQEGFITLGIKHLSNDITLNPAPDAPVQAGEHIVCIGSHRPQPLNVP